MKNFLNLNQLSMSWNEKQKPQRAIRYAAMLIMLLTLGVGQMWAGKGFWGSGQWNVKYYDGSGSDKWIGEGNDGATKDLGIKTTLYLKGSWVKTWSDGGWTQSSVVWNYGLSSSYGNTKTATKSSVQGNQTWDFSVDYNVIANAPNNPGQNTIYMYWRLDDYVSSTASYINFTIPGFKKTSVSQDFGNVTVSSTKDLTISFTQHYGTALTTSNCALSGTNSSEFEVRSISETGVTVRFKPSSNGSKSATLTITDAHSKTCTITLSGKTQRAVTYKKGDNGTGSDITDYKVYNTNLTLRSSGFTRTGYNLTAWNTSSNGTSGTSYALGATYSSNNALTLYPTWTAKTTTITLNNQGATTAGTTSVTATYDQEMPEIIIPTKTGYTFGGYWGAPGGSGPQYYNADGSSAHNWNDEASTITLYAKWTENMSSVSLVASPTGKGSFTIGGAAATSTTAGVATTRSVTAVPISGYHFVSWSITGGATISGSTDNPVTVTGDGTGTAATLTATFAADAASYTITYGAGNSPYNNGTVSEGHSYASGSSQTAGTQISLTATPTNAHYKLAGWYSEAACSSAIAGAGTTNPYEFTLGANTSVYAKFILKQCTITLNKNGGSTGAASVTASHGSTLPSFTAHSRTGYTLDGYYTDPSTGTKIIDASGALVASTTYANASKQWNNDATSLTLYAHWTAKTYDITYVDANNVATIATNPSTGSTDATINFTVTMKPGFKSLSVTAVDAGSNTVTVTNPSSNNYRFTMPASAVTVTVTATALPVVYVLKTKHANSSLGDDATGLPSTATIWAWTFSGSKNFYTTPGSFPGPSASSKATAITDDIIGDEWYRFIPDNTSYFDGSTAYHVILTSTNRILDTETTFIENGSSHSAATHTGTIWIVPHGTDANTAYLYTSYPDEIVTPYNTTYYAGDHGSINVFGTTITSGNSQTIATTKNRTLTATPASGYAFNRWITTGSVTVADATSATTTVSATGAGGTVTATYFETVNSGWYIKGNPAGNDWGTPTTLPLNRVLPGETNVYYRPVTLPANDQYFRFWHVETGNPQYGASTGNLAVLKDTKYDISKEIGKDGNSFKYSAGGTVWFVVDASGATKKFWLQDPVEFYSVNFGYSDGCKTFSAKDGEGNDLVSGNTYVSGTELTFTQTKKEGYTFVGWNTAADGSGSSLGTGSSYTVASLSADVNVYAIYTENKTAITINTDGHGTITTPSPNSSPYSLGVATTQAINATANEGYHWNTWTTSGNAALGTTATTASNTAKGNGAEGGTGTVTATFTPNTYTVRFHRNGGAGDVVEQNFTYGVAQNLTANTYTKTGYNFAGWALAADAAVTYADEANVSNLTSTNSGTFHLYAKWTPKTTTITYSQSGTGYGSGGQSTTQTATYDAAMPTPITTPTAANGYAFMGYYDALEPLGNKYYNADGTSARTWNKEDATATLYAYFKKAEITELVFDAETVEPESTVGVTPTISPTPVGTTIICWTILHSNDTPLDPQPAMTWSDGKLTFAASTYSGTYKVQAVLRTGNDCSGGTSLDTETASFLVAGSHTVTVNYKCGDDVIKTATSVTGRPTDWSDDITAPDIFGYTFVRWDAEDGVTIKNGDSDPVTTTTNATIQIEATYAGKLTAVYTQKSMIYFKNTLGWSDVYVNFYTGSYWNNPKGSGNNGVTNQNLAMTQYGETDIWYYDYGAASITPSLYVSFTSKSQSNSENFWHTDGVDVVYPANYADNIHSDRAAENGFKAATPMFVPLAAQDYVLLNGKAHYYNAGYWSRYTPGTGYRLEIYNEAGNSMIKYKDFESADDLMPMKAVLDLEGGQTYKFQIRRGGESSAGIYYGNSGTMDYTNHGQDVAWDLTNYPSMSKAGITTNAAGDYTFNLSYSAYHNKSTGKDEYRLRIAVDYPVASGDYRLVYSDAVQTKPLTSAIVNKVNDGTDIVSFFVRPGSTPVLRIQQATVNPSTGAITWNEYPNSGTPTNQITGTIASTISSSGTEVYNFNLSMNGSGALTVASAEVYDGNFYIRTDAANSKWDNYRTDPDHLMTYSEYSIDHGGYTHYYTHWVNKDDAGRKNVKFVIANDYSPNISDTLAREAASGTWANIASFMEEGGDLKRSANVRFMWDKRDNTISRAYVDGAQGDYSTNFLYMLNVEDGADKIRKSDESALTDHKVTFKDNGNWMYEANIQAQPEAAIKLLSNWGTSNTITQYFRGASDATETLLGGSGSTWYDIRVIYDFKTNRLIAGLIPSGNISDPMAIHADVMFIREHQGDIAQVTFTEDGAITDIETAYGVLQFNKWTINNKSKADGHAPLSPLLSAYERDLFYISFPFRVSMEEVFGFGTYGQHWIIEEYDGASRAANGYWAESGPNWKFVFNRKNKFFEPGTGYIIALDLDEMGESADIWANTDRVELYFPSYGKMDNITSSTATYDIPAHLCTIDRSNEPKPGGGTLGDAYDRRVKDSHWNVLGVPTYVNPDAPNYANTAWTASATETSIGPNFLYQWNMDDNSVSAVSASGYTYHAMHAYLVQYCGNVTWTSSVSVKPSPIVARERTAPKNVEFKVELMQNEKAVDQTFVKLSDNENVTTGFEFNYDMSKEFNKNKANIYTMITSNIDGDLSITEAAGNTLPMSDQTTIVPVGVDIKTNGDYTFAIPDGTSGVGVTLIDTENNIRTSLSALSYTVNLTAGTHDGRFLLEIAPIQQTPTGRGYG